MLNPNEHEFLFITPSEEGSRVDKILADRFPNHSRTYFQYLLGIGSVLLNGERIKKRMIADEGDEIEVYFQATPEASIAPEKIPLDILYEDDHILAVNKPSGLVVHPAPGHWSGTFVNALLFHCNNLPPSSDPLRPGIVHRLDKETTGILLGAKTAEAHQKLIKAFSNRKIEKVYLALCSGRPAMSLVNLPIGRHPVNRKEMSVLPDGKEAITEVKLLASNDKFGLVLAKPKTGRTHQIRVHLKHVGAPVIGDKIYGKNHLENRHLLHAYQLNFNHPITKAPVRLVAPIPEDMKNWIRKLSDEPLLSPALSS